MKKIAFVTILLSLAMASCAENVKVMSFNLRVCNSETQDGNNNWKYRRDAVVRMLREEQPDLLGTQEGILDMISYLKDRLPEYEEYGVDREDGQGRGECNAIFWRKDRFECIEKHTFWLSPTPLVPSLGWDGAYKRVVSWVKLRDKASGEEVFFFNTHFDHVGTIARTEAGKMIVRQMKHLLEESNAPVFLTGDFNSNYDSQYLAPLNDYLMNARETAEVSSDYNTFNNFGTISLDGPRTSIIDHIFFLNTIPLEYRILTGYYGVMWISDHYPITCEFSGL